MGHPSIFLPAKGLRVCVNTPTCMFKQSTSCPWGPLGLGVALSAFWKIHWGGAHTGSGRGLGLFWQGVLGTAGTWNVIWRQRPWLWVSKTLWPTHFSTHEGDPSQKRLRVGLWIPRWTRQVAPDLGRYWLRLCPFTGKDIMVWTINNIVT